MKNQFLALCLGVATLGAGPISFAPLAAYAQDEVSFEFFQESLSPYGDWIQVGDYGLCWQPAGVSEDWSPYTDGYWTYTDAGWTWVSYEEFGGITYHYGRWVSVEGTGWCWVPDYDWGPAWVSWRNSDEYVGWAPLPPEATWDASVGIGVTVDNSYDIGPEYYNFCDVADFGAPVIREVLIPRPRNEVIIINTVNITNITVNTGYHDGYWGGGLPFCGGPRYDFISRHVRRPIPALKLVRETNITNIYNNTVVNNTTVINRNGRGRGRAVHAVQRGNQLIVPAPRIRRMENPAAQLKIKPQRVIAKENVRVNKGWRLAEKAGKREEIRERMNRGTADLPRGQRAKAKPIQAADLAVVPEKADPNATVPGANGRNRRDREQRERNGGGKPDNAIVQTPDASEPGRNGGGRKRDQAEDAVAGRPGRGGGRGQNADKPGATAETQPQVAPGEPTPGNMPENRGEKKRGRNQGVTDAASPGENGKRDQENAVAERREKAKNAADAARAEAVERKNKESLAESRKALREQQQAEQSRKQQSQAAEAAEQRSKQMERQAERKRENAATDRPDRPDRRQTQEEDTNRASAVRERAAAQAAAREQAQMQSKAAERRQESAEAANRVRRQQAAQSEAGEQRRQAAALQRQQAARQQQQAERSQAVRQQQQQQQQQVQRNQAARAQQQQQMQQRAVQAQRQQQVQRSQQMQQMQRQQQARQQMQQQQPQAQRQQGGGGGGGGRGGGRNLSPEERAERRGR